MPLSGSQSTGSLLHSTTLNWNLTHLRDIVDWLPARAYPRACVLTFVAVAHVLSSSIKLDHTVKHVVVRKSNITA